MVSLRTLVNNQTAGLARTGPVILKLDRTLEAGPQDLKFQLSSLKIDHFPQSFWFFSCAKFSCMCIMVSKI